MWNGKKVVGIIAEYNPMHNGHIYLIEQAKIRYQADYVVVVMSGDFVQRGEPAILNKQVRASIALEHGVDLVLENPIICCTANMPDLIHSAISIFSRLGIVDCIAFGSECGSIEFLMDIASFMCTDTYHYQVVTYKKAGLSSDEARNNACCLLLQKYSDACNLNSPNNLVACYIIKEIITQKSNIEPITIRRVGQGYFEESFDGNNIQFISSSALRKLLYENKKISNAQLQSYMPISFENLVLQKDISFVFFQDLEKMIWKVKDTFKTDYLSTIYGAREIDLVDFSRYISCKVKSIAYGGKKFVKYKRFLIRALLGITSDCVENSIANSANFKPNILGVHPRMKTVLEWIETIDYEKNIIDSEIRLKSEDLYKMIKCKKGGQK